MELNSMNKNEAKWEGEEKPRKFLNNVNVGVAAVAVVLSFPLVAVAKSYRDNSSEKATPENLEESEAEADKSGDESNAQSGGTATDNSGVPSSGVAAPQQANNQDMGETSSNEVSPRPGEIDVQPNNDETAENKPAGKKSKGLRGLVDNVWPRGSNNPRNDIADEPYQSEVPTVIQVG